MKFHPAIADPENLLRALVRISVVLIPSLVYVTYAYPDNKLKFLGLINNKSGFVWGIVIAALLFLSSYLYFIYYLDFEYRLPTGLARWGNWIIISPFAEEILFRVVLFQELKKTFTLWSAILLSSFFFVLIHLPPIIFLANDITILGVFFYCGKVFIIGVFLAYVFNKSDSLWGSVIPHWVNNLFSMGVLIGNSQY